MSTSFPSSVQTFDTLTPGPSGSRQGDGNIHTTLHNNASDTLVAIQQYLLDTPIASGSYTPTLTNVTNLSASTAYQCQYMQVGSVVTVSGKVSVDPTSTGSTKLGISLPVTSNLGAAENLGGVAFASGIAGQGAAVLGDATNNRAQMEWIAVDITNQAMYFSFTYLVI